MNPPLSAEAPPSPQTPPAAPRHEGSAPPSAQPPAKGWGGWPYLLGLLLVLAFGGLVAAGMVPKLRRQEALEAATNAALSRVPTVRVAHPKHVPPTTSVLLPGTVAAARDTMLYARASGYVKSWKADLGDHVKAGEALAEIDQPDTDQQLLQAKATLEQSRASIEQAKTALALAKLNLGRQQQLGPQITPQQDIDTAQTNFDAARAGLAAAEAKARADDADVHRLEELISFGHVVAPFDGVIAQRSIEVGNLVSAGSTTATQPLYHLLQTDPVLILVDVPQVSAPAVTVGEIAKISGRDRSTPAASATVSHLARALDPVTRTMHVELLAPNHDGTLMPGMYVQVDIAAPSGKGLLSLSAACLLLTGEGTRVAVVGADGRIALKHIVIDTDQGATLVVSSGVTPDDRVVTNPAGLIEDGMQVDVAEDQPAAPAPAASDKSDKSAKPAESEKSRP